MAVTITTNPEDYTPAYSPVVFGFTISDIGSYPEAKEVGYQLVNGSGQSITPVNHIKAPIAGEYLVDFRKDLQGHVYTFLPECDLPGIATDTGILFEYGMLYGDIVHNATTCETAVNVEEESGPYYVLNIAPNIYDDLDFTGEVLLSHQPTTSSQDINARNFTWLFGTSSITYTPSTGSPVIVSAPFDVNIIPLHPQGMFPATWHTLKWMTVTITALSKTFRIEFECRSESANDQYNVLFLSNLGGRNMISFQKVDTTEVAGSYDNIDVRQPFTLPNFEDNDIATKQSVRGRSIFNKQSDRRLTLMCKSAIDAETLAQYEDFASSAGYHIQVPIGEGIGWRKFLVEPGGIQVAKHQDVISMTVTGVMADPMRAQRFDR